MTNDASRFIEVQTFTQIWLWVLLLIAALAAVFASSAVLPNFEGTSGGIFLRFWLDLMPAILILWFFLSLRLITRVNQNGIQVQLKPFKGRAITFSEIQSVNARAYQPIREYGGYGWRFSPKGKAFNVKGDQGVQLVLKTGERILIGSQEAPELERVIKLYL